MTLRKFPLLWAASVGLILAMSACGGATSTGGAQSSSGSAASSTSSDAAPLASADAALSGKLPANIKSAGVLQVATDASSPPMEFFAADGKTLQGFDIDLGNAIGERLGIRLQWTNLASASIIPGLQNGRFDMALTSAQDLPERRAVFTFVDYFDLASSLLVKSGNPQGLSDFKSLCGHTVGVQAGTAQLIGAKARQKDCPAAKPIDIKTFPDNNAVFLSLGAGRVDAAYAQTIVNVYLMSKAKGQYEALPGTYDHSLVGAAFPKDSKLVDAVQATVQKLIDDGTYGRLLQKWSLDIGAVKTATINGGA